MCWSGLRTASSRTEGETCVRCLFSAPQPRLALCRSVRPSMPCNFLVYGSMTMLPRRPVARSAPSCPWCGIPRVTAASSTTMCDVCASPEHGYLPPSGCTCACSALQRGWRRGTSASQSGGQAAGRRVQMALGTCFPASARPDRQGILEDHDNFCFRYYCPGHEHSNVVPCTFTVLWLNSTGSTLFPNLPGAANVVKITP